MIELPVITSAKDTTRPNRKPDWLRVKLPVGEEYAKVRKIVDEYKLHTICESGNCPNMGECWGAGTATFMILGNVCTRSCTFCAVATGRPHEYDTDEPRRVAEAVKLMGVKHCVITSVNRDELKDRGAEIWYQTVMEVKKASPHTTIETLIPDVKGNWDALIRMIDAGQEVFSQHGNSAAVVPASSPASPVRTQPGANPPYQRLWQTYQVGYYAGPGRNRRRGIPSHDDLVANGLDVLTLGQYLQPTKMHIDVAEFIHPDQFAAYKEEGMKRGLKYVESGALVRSSYHAEKHVYV